MATRLLQLDDIRQLQTPDKIAFLFQKLGYNAQSSQLDIKDLELPARSTEAIWNAYLIANQGDSELQVLLFHLQSQEFSSPTVASNRMKAIATSLGKRPSNFLLLGTSNYNQLMVVNPRKSFDAQMNLEVGIRKLVIDRTSPTNYDRDRLEAIAARGKSPQELYQTQCEAFDVEKLTKQFFKGYKDLFERVQQVVKQHNHHPYFNDDARAHQFSQRLLGRIMFLYFLQKKEFLAGDRKFLTTKYRKLRPDPEDTDYYINVLEPLFFETLNEYRPNFESDWGKIPYLNGGLFDRDYGKKVIDATGLETPERIEIPNSLFDPGESNSVLNFFNSYNFTVAENVEGDEDVAVDPEMLGKVFENMLEVEERGKSGTFYTPRGIVHFMCTEVLSRYLADETEMDLETVKKIIDFDSEQSDSYFKELMTPQQAGKLKQALENLRCLDPAVGSAAFPMGMMQVILGAYQSIGRREGESVKRGSLRMSELKRNIIANNLYGVDIKPEAIEIAKLRMWLSLVVDIPNIDDVVPLPNLDYKLMCGDSLISTIDGEQLIPDPTKTQQTILAVTPISKAIQPLLKLQQQYFDAQSEERQELRKQILEAEANVFQEAITQRLQHHQTQQRYLEKDIKTMKGKISKAQAKKQQEISEKLTQLDKIVEEVKTRKRSLSFFQYHLHFRDVFESKGGFDIVIGNPPYVRQEQIKELKPALKEEYECYTGVADFYIYFFEQGYRLLKSGGALTYISSNKYFRAGYGEKLRKFLGEQATVQHLIDFGDASVFEAIAYPSIILVSKAKPDNHQTRVLNWDTKQPINEFASVFKNKSFYVAQKQLTPDGWRLESPEVLRLLDKLRDAGTPLGKYVNGRFYYGIKTGLNEAFVVDRATRDRLIAEHPSSAEVLKPFLRGRDIKRWNINNPDLWLLFIPWHFPLHNDSLIQGVSMKAEKEFKKLYPAIYSHLLKFKTKLSARNKAETGIRYEWYALQRCASTYWQEFSRPKIVYQEIATHQAFAYEQKGYFLNKTTFFIPTDDFYLFSLLNSKISKFFLGNIVTKIQGGAYNLQAIYVSQLPIAKASEKDCHILSSLVQKCLNANGQDVKNWEAEIDNRVAHLYGLTQQEMKIIKGE